MIEALPPALRAWPSLQRTELQQYATGDAFPQPLPPKLRELLTELAHEVRSSSWKTKQELAAAEALAEDLKKGPLQTIKDKQWSLMRFVTRRRSSVDQADIDALRKASKDVADTPVTTNESPVAKDNEALVVKDDVVSETKADAPIAVEVPLEPSSAPQTTGERDMIAPPADVAERTTQTKTTLAKVIALVEGFADDMRKSCDGLLDTNSVARLDGRIAEAKAVMTEVDTDASKLGKADMTAFTLLNACLTPLTEMAENIRKAADELHTKTDRFQQVAEDLQEAVRNLGKISSAVLPKADVDGLGTRDPNAESANTTKSTGDTEKSILDGAARSVDPVSSDGPGAVAVVEQAAVQSAAEGETKEGVHDNTHDVAPGNDEVTTNDGDADTLAQEPPSEGRAVALEDDTAEAAAKEINPAEAAPFKPTETVTEVTTAEATESTTEVAVPVAEATIESTADAVALVEDAPEGPTDCVGEVTTADGMDKSTAETAPEMTAEATAEATEATAEATDAPAEATHTATADAPAEETGDAGSAVAAKVQDGPEATPQTEETETHELTTATEAVAETETTEDAQTTAATEAADPATEIVGDDTNPAADEAAIQVPDAEVNPAEAATEATEAAEGEPAQDTTVTEAADIPAVVESDEHASPCPPSPVLETAEDASKVPPGEKDVPEPDAPAADAPAAKSDSPAAEPDASAEPDAPLADAPAAVPDAPATDAPAGAPAADAPVAKAKAQDDNTPAAEPAPEAETEAKPAE